MPITDRGRRVVQGQRAGLLPADHADMFPGLAWKQPGYTKICQGYLTGGTVDPADAAAVDWANFPGYFEAGSAYSPLPIACTQRDCCRKHAVAQW